MLPKPVSREDTEELMEAADLVVATGHFRNGILLTPITAELVADLGGCRSGAVDLAPFAATGPRPAP